MNAPIKNPVAARPDVETAIIGTGFSGLGMAIQLLKSGRKDFAIFEKASTVGGTWRENTYPGCACDVPSHLYSFSFEPNPNWSRMFAPQEEIRGYIEHCVEKYALTPYIRFNKEITQIRYDDATQLWNILTSDGGSVSARKVISGMGPLHKPVYPTLKGIDSFEGKTFHSATWDHDFDFSGKRVAVIGTGASAIQFVPQIVPKVAALTLFQRTPPWVMPKADRDMKPWEKSIFSISPFLQKLFRGKIYVQMEIRALGFTVNPKLMSKVRDMGVEHIANTIDDEALRAQLTPDFMPGCKRLLQSNDYYPSLNQSHVDVVSSGVAEVKAHSIVTEAGEEIEVDAIIYGTGFEAADPIAKGQIIGPNGQDLAAMWADKGAEAYLGTSVSGFPNLFFMTGPNTGLGHNSIILMIEAQVGYILDALDLMDKKELATLDVREDIQRSYNDSLQDKIKKTVWATGCDSWYQREDGKNTTLWPSFTFSYMRRMNQFNPEDYVISSPKLAHTPQAAE